jgi:3-isopropylmalate/(R)-2-methylmalate dehydratase small subunit
LTTETRVLAGDGTFAFQIDPVWRIKLLNGWDDIDITRRYQADIVRWLETDAVRRPWAAVPPP